MKNAKQFHPLSENALRVLKVSSSLRQVKKERRIHFAKIDGEIYGLSRSSELPNADLYWERIKSNISPNIYPTQVSALVDLSRKTSGLWVLSEVRGWLHSGDP